MHTLYISTLRVTRSTFDPAEGLKQRYRACINDLEFIPRCLLSPVLLIQPLEFIVYDLPNFSLTPYKDLI